MHVQELCKVVDLYVLAHVPDDIGQAVVTGAMEAAGLVGHGKLPAHRLLFCSTPEGKVSIVRQIEPDLHIDGHVSTVEELRRFMPQLLLVGAGGSPVVDGPNIGQAPSLSAFFA